VRQQKKETRLAKYAKAMGHPIRLTILKILDETEGCYAGNLGDRLPIAPSTLTQHLKVLSSAGLIKGCSEAQRIKYCLDRDGWEEARALFADFYEAGRIHSGK